MTAKTTFNRRLCAAMALRGIKADELADVSGVPVSSIYQYRSVDRPPSDERIVILAAALSVFPEWLTGESHTMESNND